MEKRLQTINGDTVLEVSTTTKTRYSENALLSRKRYLEQNIGRYEEELAKVEELLADIEHERAKGK